VRREPLKNEVEGRGVLAQKVAELRGLGYEGLRARMSPGRSLFGGRVEFGGGATGFDEVQGPSGALYQLEHIIAWDGRTRGDIRVIVYLFEDSATRTLSEDFIIASDGSFIDE
jgi:hypothetical protein